TSLGTRSRKICFDSFSTEMRSYFVDDPPHQICEKESEFRERHRALWELPAWEHARTEEEHQRRMNAGEVDEDNDENGSAESRDYDYEEELEDRVTRELKEKWINRDVDRLARARVMLNKREAGEIKHLLGG